MDFCKVPKILGLRGGGGCIALWFCVKHNQIFVLVLIDNTCGCIHDDFLGSDRVLFL